MDDRSDHHYLPHRRISAAFNQVRACYLSRVAGRCVHRTCHHQNGRWNGDSADWRTGKFLRRSSQNTRNRSVLGFTAVQHGNVQNHHRSRIDGGIGIDSGGPADYRSGARFDEYATSQCGQMRAHHQVTNHRHGRWQLNLWLLWSHRRRSNYRISHRQLLLRQWPLPMVWRDLLDLHLLHCVGSVAGIDASTRRCSGRIDAGCGGAYIRMGVDSHPDCHVFAVVGEAVAE
mmetsp:Transcript_20967/g.33465  ORF Transcript_20967/g.33465 Transcript_20967/m.33465 type:complete len:230 (+) Transcript_20967:503-1192(+)